MERDSKIWLDTAVRLIRFGPDRRAVREELAAHLEDKIADHLRLFPDMDEEEAETRALNEMGDAAEIGRALGKIHKPWLGYVWMASRVLVIVGVLWLLATGLFRGDDAYLGDDPRSEWWDTDGLPRTAIMGNDDDLRYLPGEDPDQLLALEPGLRAEVNGQNISLLRTALWREEDGLQTLYCYLRVNTWRFWERGVLREDWMKVTDSKGKVYGLGEDTPEDPEISGLLNGMAPGGYGPFHSGYELYLRKWDPEAEWVRLDYGPGEPVFTFTVDLEEGTA